MTGDKLNIFNGTTCIGAVVGGDRSLNPAHIHAAASPQTSHGIAGRSAPSGNGPRR